jgi:hypothetical protein
MYAILMIGNKEKQTNKHQHILAIIFKMVYIEDILLMNKDKDI